MCGRDHAVNSSLFILYTDDDECYRDPIETNRPTCSSDEDQLLNGAFTNVYQKAMREELPETESVIKNSIDYKLSMRQVGVAGNGCDY